MPGLTLFGCKKKYIVFTKIKNLKKIVAGERIENLDFNLGKVDLLLPKHIYHEKS